MSFLFFKILMERLKENENIYFFGVELLVWRGFGYGVGGVGNIVKKG